MPLSRGAAEVEEGSVGMLMVRAGAGKAAMVFLVLVAFRCLQSSNTWASVEGLRVGQTGAAQRGV
jgi:hypothetical protein